MRLFFDEITGKTNRYSITDSLWFPLVEECSVIAATASLSVSRRDHETIMLEGEINCRCRINCDRCGESYEENFQSEFVYLATTRGEDRVEVTEQECSDGDTLTLYLPEPTIEVDEILREQAWLAVPQKNVCSEDCKGVCAGCGVVLHKESCRCESDKCDSPFAVLKRMKNK
jgi:uncharacterized protein